MEIPWAVIVRPFGALVLLLTAALLTRPLERYIPDSKLKRVLYRRHKIVPDFQTRRNVLFWQAAVLLFIGLLVSKFI